MYLPLLFSTTLLLAKKTVVAIIKATATLEDVTARITVKRPRPNKHHDDTNVNAGVKL
jgi:hypothetical protein